MSLHLVVISDPAAPHLRLLDPLREKAQIVMSLERETLAAALPEADVILNGMNVGHILRAVWPAANKVRWVHSLSAGLDGVLFPELVASPVVVTNARGVFREPLAEFVILGILYFAKHVPRLLAQQRRSEWKQFYVEEIAGRTLGVVGYGEIGRAAAAKAHALGMRIAALRRRPGLSAHDPLRPKLYSRDQLRQMMADCDYIVAAAPLTPETRGMIGAAELDAMKPTGVIINVGRGPVIDEAPLITALAEKRIRGAALDVFEQEPLPPDHPLWRLDNVLISPHTADQTEDWLQRATQLFVENFRRFVAGEPLLNVVDKEAGY
jgi:phosphoglycerate dehydrogenase-like enzyme